MKLLHKVLQLHPHKHTGKVLPHKHTSYGVLFLLMIIPVLLMAVVDRMTTAAADYSISATVPASIPEGAPVITSPVDGSTTTNSSVTIIGTCPPSNQPVIIAVYDKDAFIGSTQCSSEGTFSLQVTLSPGLHELRAVIISATGDVGSSSDSIAITRAADTINESSLSISDQNTGLRDVVRLHLKDPYIVLDYQGNTTLSLQVLGGESPYSLHIEWGDGSSDTYRIADSSDQHFAHKYQILGTYGVVVTATDATGEQMTVHSTAITYALQNRAWFDDSASLGSVSPLVAFLDRYVWHIYIATLSSLVFLWYIEHGRHIVTRSTSRLRHR